MAGQNFVLKLLVVSHLWLSCGVHDVFAITTKPPLRPVCPPKPARCRTSSNYNSRNEHFYVIEDQDLIVQFQDGNHFQLTCPENITLEDKNLPRFSQRVYVEKVIITHCSPPSTSYVEALAALNVTLLEWLQLDDGLFTSETPLEARHLATLSDSVWKLTITGLGNEPISENFTFNPSISDLRLTNVVIPSPVLYNLPVNLRTLHLMNTTLQSIPTAVLERLNRMERIYLQDNGITVGPEFSAAPALRDVFILEPLERLPSLAKLENVSLWSVKDLGSNVFGDCTELKRLSLGYVDMETLPIGWLANCSQLEWLELSFISTLKSLPYRLLAGASSLDFMSVRYCPDLTDLPADLFTSTTQLSYLELSFNNLTNLPSGLFSPLVHLDYLDLSNNQLSGSARPALEGLTSPHTLVLANNPLGDLCDGVPNLINVNGVSSLSHMISLKKLDLMATGVTQLCRDWRTACSLTNIDLQNNNITMLQYDNLKFLCPAKVDLRGNPIEAILYTWKNYKDVVSSTQYKQEANVTLEVDSLLDCDCHMYWFARAYHERPGHLALPDLRCRDQDAVGGTNFNDNYLGEEGETQQGTLFASISPEDMTCNIEKEYCAENCSCYAKPRENIHGITRAVCVNASLTRVPRLPTSAPALGELMVHGNAITKLYPEDLPASLLVIDVSNNSIEHVDGETTARLFSEKSRTVRLAGNPLACDCANRLFLVALQAYQNQVLDYVNVTCAGGRFVRDVEASGLCVSRAGLRAALAVGGVALLLAAVGAILMRYRPQLVSRVKAALLKRGICVRWALRPPQIDRDIGDEDKRYDVFVSFAHGDHRFVAECLVPRLETYRYRVCVHYRDFMPGEMISSQIETSVRNSRRTIVVLTEKFAQSTWGKAEFRFAHAMSVRDSRPRLVVIVMGTQKPEELPNLDQEWKDYLASNTYLNCDDPWFWQRLKVALGRPRPSSTSSIEAML